ncbi:serine hydroxymethyltransferase [candidate division KSB1 bacterium]|nr:serine hydroxymethyltransferase [candidate division KSB1 bacterium]TDI82856.1 MAG: serine hydroxymethyltransferase [Caldithrix sp.]
MNEIERTDPELYEAVINETRRQNSTLELIASENFVSLAVLQAAGQVMTNKYAEGYPGKRYYGGCEFVDVAENLARERAKKLFSADYVNVQPHSGSQANIAAYFSVLKPGDKILGMDLSHGGHLTHGSPVNFSGRIFDVSFYGVEKSTGRIDLNLVDDIASSIRPKLIITGASAYSRKIDYEGFRQIADKVGAYLLCDMAHPAGLIASGLLPSPVPHCHFVTTTTHKTLRGPRGGMIIVGKDSENDLGFATPKGRVKLWSEVVDSNVFPGFQGGPLMHIIAAKAVALKEALEPSFRGYSAQVIKNAQALATKLGERGYEVVSGGTDTHLLLIDLRSNELTGKEAETRLEEAGITVNKNMVPFDSQSPFVTSGIRIGTPALTTRNMKESEMEQIAFLIDRILSNINDDTVLGAVRGEASDLCSQFPLYEV